jgi:hypothetical protein
VLGLAVAGEGCNRNDRCGQANRRDHELSWRPHGGSVA